MGDLCLATPAISDGMIFVRTQHFLYAIGRRQISRADGSPRDRAWENGRQLQIVDCRLQK
jgi:hypothetical protein